jgi:hypothetical protein
MRHPFGELLLVACMTSATLEVHADDLKTKTRRGLLLMLKTEGLDACSRSCAEIVRRFAAGDMEYANSEVVQALVPLLEVRDGFGRVPAGVLFANKATTSVATHAAWTLGMIGPAAVEAFDPLAALLHGGAEYECREAANALMTIDRTRAAPILQKELALCRPGTLAHTTIFAWLASLDPNPGKYVPDLSRLVAKGDDDVASQAAIGLARLGSAARPAAGSLQIQLRRSLQSSGGGIYEPYIDALVAIGGDTAFQYLNEARETAIHRLKDEPAIQGNARAIIVALGKLKNEKAYPILVELLSDEKDNHPRRRELAACAVGGLAEMGPAGKRALPEIEAYLTRMQMPSVAELEKIRTRYLEGPELAAAIQKLLSQ